MCSEESTKAGEKAGRNSLRGAAEGFEFVCFGEEEAEG